MSLAYVNSQSSNGTNVLTQAGAYNVTWNLTSLEVSFAGPTWSPNAKLTIYDGSQATGTVIFADFLNQPSGSVGIVQAINIPVDAQGRKGLQATPGNAMTIVVNGFGNNQCSINARFTDGLP